MLASRLVRTAAALAVLAAVPGCAAKSSGSPTAAPASGPASSSPGSGNAGSSSPGSGSPGSGSPGSGSPGAASPGAGACSKGFLKTYAAGKLTIGTDKPAYDPWFSNNDPSNGKGFESAVAYAVADKLGFAHGDVRWTVVPFNSSYAPGQKKFDFDINQISITPERAKVVDFSSGYYTVNQAVIALKSSKLASVRTVADLKPFRFGVQIGTTSLKFVQDVVKPDKKPAVFDTTNDAKSALQNRQVDGIVVDLPTGFYLTAAEIPRSVIVGQFSQPATGAEQFGLLMPKRSPLQPCVDAAIAELTSSGELTKLQDQWLSQTVSVPVFR